jgi:hypothetical protein
MARKLEGRWFGESVEHFDEDEIAASTGWVKGTSWEFFGSSVTITIPAEDPRSGRYEVVSARDGHLTLSIVDPAGKGHRASLTLEDEHLLRWHLDDTRSVLLRRNQ